MRSDISLMFYVKVCVNALHCTEIRDSAYNNCCLGSSVVKALCSSKDMWKTPRSTIRFVGLTSPN